MMGLPTAPQPSALQSFFQAHEPPRNSSHPPHLHYLALQVAHNLRYQHGWKDVRIHYRSSGPLDEAAESAAELPRPLLSGLPPRRLYVHPDEQIEILQRQKRLQQESGEGQSEGSAAALGLESLEREWVLPSHLREKWTLRRFGEVFDCIAAVPGNEDGEVLFDEANAEAGAEEEEVVVEGDGEANEWRANMPKRLLLATLDDDSTVVYYIIHDGIVKPRQN